MSSAVSPRLPKATLIQLISTLTGVDTLWRHDPAPADPGTEFGSVEMAMVWLKTNSYRAVGTDEQRSVYNAQADAIHYLNVGQRQFTLSCRAESFDPGIGAADLCERIRFGMYSDTARGIFAPANLSLLDIQPIAEFEQNIDSRTLLVATMDIRWNFVVFFDPSDLGEGGYIQTVDGGKMIDTPLPEGHNPPYY